MKKHIPNTLTCCNLLMGCFGIVFSFKDELAWAAYAIFIAAIFDFFDGMFARWLKAYSEIGKQLDSLADMVSFGVLPAFIVYQLFLKANSGSWLPYLALFIAVFSALRLAKFNVDERQSENFIGLPTPANALFIASLPLILQSGHAVFTPIILNPLFLSGLCMVMSFLLVCELPLISLKFKDVSWQNNLYRYILIIGSLVFISIFTFAAIPLILVLYITLSVIYYRFNT